MKLLVKNGILPGRGACDMLVEDGRIAKIEPNLEDADAQVVDAQVALLVHEVKGK